MNKLSNEEILAILLFGEFCIEFPEDLPENAQELAENMQKYLLPLTGEPNNTELMNKVVNILNTAIERVKNDEEVHDNQ